MVETVYKFIELVGTSTESWERAAAVAIEQAGKSLRDMRVAEVTDLDVQIENGRIIGYRAKVKLSFRVEAEQKAQWKEEERIEELAGISEEFPYPF